MNTDELPSMCSGPRLTRVAQGLSVIVVLLFALATPRLLASDDHNPIGVTGAFEGVITTGGAYNVLNHNATREIDDIVVPGSIGKYP